LPVFLYEFKTSKFTFSKYIKWRCMRRKMSTENTGQQYKFFHKSISEFQLISHSTTEKIFLSCMYLDQNKCLTKNFRRRLLHVSRSASFGVSQVHSTPEYSQFLLFQLQIFMRKTRKKEEDCGSTILNMWRAYVFIGTNLLIAERKWSKNYVRLWQV
jgi:hypothetical protein